MRIDINNHILQRHDLAACRGHSRLLDIGFSPSEIVICGFDQIGDGDRHGIIDRRESSGGDLLFEPLLLVGSGRSVMVIF